MVHVRELCFEKDLLVFALLQRASVLFVFFFFRLHISFFTR